MKVSIKLYAGALLMIVSSSCTKAVIDEDINPDGVPTDITYNPEVANIMFNNCTTCHGGAAPSAGLSLTTYQDVRFSAENGNLIDRMNDAGRPMPPNGLLPAEERIKIDNWASNGFPENK